MLLIGSLWAPFFRVNSEAVFGTWQTFEMIVRQIGANGMSLISTSWSNFLQDELPAYALLVSYFLALPGILLLLLATRSMLLCWLGRLIWPLLWMTGPMLFLRMVTPNYFDLDFGAHLWIAATSLIVLAHWVVVPLRPRSEG